MRCRSARGELYWLKADLLSSVTRDNHRLEGEDVPAFGIYRDLDPVDVGAAESLNPGEVLQQVRLIEQGDCSSLIVIFFFHLPISARSSAGCGANFPLCLISAIFRRKIRAGEAGVDFKGSPCSGRWRCSVSVDNAGARRNGAGGYRLTPSSCAARFRVRSSEELGFLLSC